MAKTVTEEDFILRSGTAARLLGWMLLGLVTATALLMLLPNRDYYRWQQGDGTILFRARYIYERIHNDPTPIDVAMIGSSRMEASIRADELAQGLSRQLGRPIHVVNFGLPQEGRDLHWTIAFELLEARPETRLIVLSASPESTLSHPGFRFLGDDASIATSPAFYNLSYVENLLTLPYRHLAYFVQGLSPSTFQLSPQFDPAIYRKLNFDPSDNFTMPGGEIVDRYKQVDPAQASSQRVLLAGTRMYDPKLQYLPLDNRYPTERHFVRKIAQLAARKHVTVAFLHIPTFNTEEMYDDPGFYHLVGPVLEATQFGSDPADYADFGHLNRTGTGKLTPWLADELAPILRQAEDAR